MEGLVPASLTEVNLREDLISIKTVVLHLFLVAHISIHDLTCSQMHPETHHQAEINIRTAANLQNYPHGTHHITPSSL